MIRDDINPSWIRIINGKYTFCGAYEDYYDEISKYWNETTCRKYDKYFNDIIFPNLENHNNKTIDEYSKEDYDNAISAIVNKGQILSPGKPYSDSTIQQFRYLIQLVVLVAAKNGQCINVLWGSSFALPESQSEADLFNERIHLKKSLTVAQEVSIARQLLQDPKQRGQEMGLLLMYALGLRNGEACGVNFGDFKPMRLHPDCVALWVYKSTISGTSTLQSSGKTRNADRVIPVPDIVYSFIKERRAFLETFNDFSETSLYHSVDELPVACVDNDYFQRCSAKKLTAAGRELFRKAQLDANQLSYIDVALTREDSSHTFGGEKDPTSYLFRRNFGTHLHNLGLNEPEIEYIIGHDIDNPYETRNEYVSEEKLWIIKCKMERRPLLNSNCLEHDTVRIDIHNPILPLSGELVQRYWLPSVPGKFIAHIETNEPGDSLTISFDPGIASSPIQSEYCLSATVPKFDRTINILKHYQEIYQKYAASKPNEGDTE